MRLQVQDGADQRQVRAVSVRRRRGGSSPKALGVALGDIQAEKGAALAAELGESALFVSLDVTSEASWKTAVETAQARFGALTTVVNSAGISVPATIEDETLEGFRRTMAINLDGAFLGCKFGATALKAWARRRDHQCGLDPRRAGWGDLHVLCRVKKGLRLLTRSVALHCASAGYDIRVNAILPGAVHTEMVDGYIAAGVAAGATREPGDRGLRFRASHEAAGPARRARQRHRLPGLGRVQFHHRRGPAGGRRLPGLNGGTPMPHGDDAPGATKPDDSAPARCTRSTPSIRS